MSGSDGAIFGAWIVAALCWAGWLVHQALHGHRDRSPERRVGMVGGAVLLVLVSAGDLGLVLDPTNDSSGLGLAATIGFAVVYPLVGLAILGTKAWTTHRRRQLDRERSLRLAYGQTLLMVAVSRWTLPYLLGLTAVTLVGTLFWGSRHAFSLDLTPVLLMVHIVQAFPIVMTLFFLLCPRRLLVRWSTEQPVQPPTGSGPTKVYPV